tara:strand:- start:1977 stop:2126 length:150 start_codon:yes stop_codon:yes gene_type:complete
MKMFDSTDTPLILASGIQTGHEYRRGFICRSNLHLIVGAFPLLAFSTLE